MAVLMALVGLVGLLQGSAWLGTRGRKGRLSGVRRRLLGVTVAPLGLLLMITGMTWALVPDFLGGR